LIDVGALAEYYNEDYVLLSDVMTPAARTAAEVGYISQMLELRPGDRVLDLGCGYGRIAQGLAEAGAQVTGIDLVPALIERARAEAERRGLTIDYRVGDIARLPSLGGFDAAIMWYFAFGYGDERSHARILKSAYAALKREGFLLFDQYNTHVLAAEHHPSLLDRGDSLVIHKPLADLEEGRWGVERIVVAEGAIRRARFSCRCYTPPELRALCLTAGFREIRFLGDDSGKYLPESRRLIVIAMK
jgi:SAM-dependent methyltransferase